MTTWLHDAFEPLVWLQAIMVAPTKAMIQHSKRSALKPHAVLHAISRRIRKFPTPIAQDRFLSGNRALFCRKKAAILARWNAAGAIRVQKSEFDVPREEAFAMTERPVLNPTEARQAVVGHNVRYVLIASFVFVVIAFVAVAFFMTR